MTNPASPISRGSLLKLNDFIRKTQVKKEYNSEMQVVTDRDINISPNAAVITESEGMIKGAEERKKGEIPSTKSSFPLNFPSPKFAHLQK